MLEKGNIKGGKLHFQELLKSLKDVSIEMNMKPILLIIYFLLLSLILAGCGSGFPDQIALAHVSEPRAAMEAPASIEETGSVTPEMQEPVATENQATVTGEPTFTEEQLPTAELTFTKEQPSATVEPISTEEIVVTEEASEEHVVIEEPTLITPAEGFWAVSGPDAQVVTVIPKDWLPPENIEFQMELDSENTGEGLGLAGFTSPDKKAFIFFIVYDDPAITEWSQSLAQERALYILNKMYTKGVGDIQVIAVQPMPDGSERLSWLSQACDCTGVIAYKAGPPSAGTVVYTKNLWLFNAFSINSYKNDYVEMFDYVFELLTFPPEVSRIDP